MKRTTAIFILSIFSITVLAQNADNNNDTPEQVEGPGISFDKTEHDYGTIERKSNGDCTFTLTNSGTKALILTNVQSSCGCAAVEWPHRPIKPGQNKTLTIRYDTRRVGSFSKSIKVYSNATDAPVVLSIKGTVEK
ncbi:MAG: DUF1573 domain-containing protein [Bacteroidota bacterium]|nr:DUF1573 domain-containing protein [Bacteroidota bacterium]